MLANGFGDMCEDIVVSDTNADLHVSPVPPTVTTGAAQELGSVSGCSRRGPSPDFGLRARGKGRFI